jgi:CheY-like chemotaxis protein
MMELLVVDDEETVGRMFAQRLRREIRDGQIVLHFATSGSEALSVIRTHGSELNFVLTDINMPGMSGFELLGKIRSLVPGLKVFMVSAYEGDEFRRQALDLGADGFFAKPLEFAELRSLLDTASGPLP